MIEVVAAVIENENGEILIAKRNLNKHQGGHWEFPGGKVEKSETNENAIIREIKEELNIDIEVKKYIGCKTHIYPEKKVEISLFRCVWRSGEFKLLEHEDYAWVTNENILDYDLVPADLEIVKEFII